MNVNVEKVGKYIIRECRMKYVLVILFGLCLRDLPGIHKGFPGLTYIHEFFHVAAFNFSGIDAYITSPWTTRCESYSLFGIYGGYGGEIVLWSLMFYFKVWWIRAFALGVLINCWLLALVSNDFYILQFTGQRDLRLTMQIIWFFAVGALIWALARNEYRRRNHDKKGM